MPSVWIVEVGTYSDTRVAAVCSTLQKAQAVEALVSDSPRITEFELDAIADQLLMGWRRWSVTISRELEISDVHLSYTPEALGPPRHWGTELYVCVEVTAKDRDHAIKAALDYARSLKAAQVPLATS